MRDLISFLTSKEVIVVYIVAAVACFLAMVIYIIDKNYTKRKQRHNTRELNKLVEEVSEVVNEEKNALKQPTLVAENIEPKEVISPKTEVIASSEIIDNGNIVLENLNNMNEVSESKEEAPVIIKETPLIDTSKEEKLEYTSIEPNKEEAKQELRKLAEELEQDETLQKTPQTIIDNYEEAQESNAIISLKELVEKSKEMYEANELSQYSDEGNEPISLEDLEKAKQTNSMPIYNEPFIIANVVSDMENELNKTEHQQLQINDFLTPNEENTIYKNEVKKEDLYKTAKFKKSPVISPIYGIERSEDDYLELENTANYDKLDEEIRKTNEFLMTLKELQKNLD